MPDESDLNIMDSFTQLLTSVVDKTLTARMGQHMIDVIGGDQNLLKLIFTNAVAAHLNSNEHVLSDIVNGNITDDQIIASLSKACVTVINSESIDTVIDETLKAELAGIDLGAKASESMHRLIQDALFNSGEIDLPTIVRDHITDSIIEEAVANYVENEICGPDITEMARDAVTDNVNTNLDGNQIEDIADDVIQEKVRDSLSPRELQRQVDEILETKIEQYSGGMLGEDSIKVKIMECFEEFDMSRLIASQLTLENPIFAEIFTSKINSVNFEELISPKLYEHLSNKLEEIAKPHVLKLVSKNADTTRVMLNVDTCDIQEVIAFLNKTQGIQDVKICGDEDSEAVELQSRQIG